MSKTASLYSLFISSFFAATLLPGGSEAVLFGVLKTYPEILWIALGVATVGNTLGGVVTFGMGWLLPQRKGGNKAAGHPTGGVNSAQPKVGGGLPTFGVLLAGANPATQARRKSAPLWHICTAVRMGAADR